MLPQIAQARVAPPLYPLVLFWWMVISHQHILSDFSHTGNFHIIHSDIQGVLAHSQKGVLRCFKETSSQDCTNPE